jgi:hypothetical protein
MSFGDTKTVVRYSWTSANSGANSNANALSVGIAGTSLLAGC